MGHRLGGLDPNQARGPPQSTTTTSGRHFGQAEIYPLPRPVILDRAGTDTEEIASRHGVGRSTVSNVAVRHGMLRNPHQPPSASSVATTIAHAPVVMAATPP